MKYTIEEFAELLGTQIHSNYWQSAVRTYQNDFDKINHWEQNIGSGIKAVVIPGRKYTKVDVCLPQQSGRYMIAEDGEIYGTKGYGVVNKKHHYGNLDTIDDYYWGDYYPVKIKKAVKNAEEV